MKKCLIVFAILILAACQRNQNNSMAPLAIRRWIENYIVAIKKADVEAILSGYSNDMIFCPSNQPAFSGKENLRRWLLAYFNYYNGSEFLFERDIKVRGNLAYVLFDYTVKVKVNHSNEVIQDDGKMINIFKPGSNGKWICTCSIWNSNNKNIDLHAQIPADFSGTWKLDLSRSTDFPYLLSSIIMIVQKGNDISINRTYEIKNQEPIKNSFKYIIGHEIKTITKTGSTTTTSFWSTDKQSFSITETLLSHNNNTKQEYKRTTIYSLTVKGEILNVNSDDILPQGSLTRTNNKHLDLIYNRQ